MSHRITIASHGRKVSARMDHMGNIIVTPAEKRLEREIKQGGGTDELFAPEGAPATELFESIPKRWRKELCASYMVTFYVMDEEAWAWFAVAY